MADVEQALADCVGAVYEAAAGGDGWFDVGERMRQVFDARSATLYLTDGATGRARNLLMPPDPSEALYAAHYHALNPYTAQAKRDFASARRLHVGGAKLGAEIVAEGSLLESEYYVDFARHHERRHMVGGVLDVGRPVPIGLFRGRDSGPFDSADVRILKTLTPHVQRALELRARLSRDRQAASLTRAAADASPVGLAIVDAHLQIKLANDRAARIFAAHGGLSCVRSGPQQGAALCLVAQSHADAVSLSRLVLSAVSGGTGGSLRIAGLESAALAVLVSPTPPGLAREMAGDDPPERTAIIVMRPLRDHPSPSPSLLCDLFGLTKAEAEVAVALSDGGTAEDVARRRGVSLETVRSQIRSILGKSESDNLRDFARSMGSLGAITPAGENREQY
jgi:DNA-binding NarL/FixJ family response regulator